MTLTACGSDAIEDTVIANYNSETGATNRGGMITKSQDGYTLEDYQSFWDITQRGKEMFYRYENLTGDIGNPAMLHFRVTPYVGLAYGDDDVYDNQFEDVFSGGTQGLLILVLQELTRICLT